MVRIVQNSFLGGQLDHEMMGRQDFARYAKGASRLVNFNIMRRGGICKRQGFDRIASLTEIMGVEVGSGAKVRLIPFAYTKERGFVLLFAGNKIKAITADPNGTDVYVKFGVDGYDNLPSSAKYAANELDEIDYQQCGDELFIAHRNHKPAKITHYIRMVDGVRAEGFEFEQLRFDMANVGKPSITGASITRVAVVSNGAKFTEEYVATAVYDDVETLPSSPYSAEASNLNPTATQETQKAEHTIDGTTYMLPWTQSQKLSLQVTVPSRTVEGVVERPSEIRVYKKAFNYYGLIASVNFKKPVVENIPVGLVSCYSTYPAFVNSGDLTTSVVDTDGISDTGSLAGSGVLSQISSVDYYETGKVTPYIRAINSKRLTGDHSSPTEAVVGWICMGRSNTGNLLGARVKLVLGGAHLLFMQGGSGINGAWFVYRGNKARRIAWKCTNAQGGMRVSDVTAAISAGRVVDAPVRDDIGIPASGNLSTSASNYIARNEGESLEDFKERANAQLLVWLDDRESELGSSLFPTVEIDNTSANGATSSVALTFASAVAENGYRSFYYHDYGIAGDKTELVISGVAACKPVSGGIASSITVVDNNIVPDASITPPEALDANLFSGAGRYPSSVCLTQQRLVWASPEKEPARVWMSQIGDFYTYNPHQIQVADDPIDFMLPVTRFPTINHMVEMRKLVMFNSACEWMVDSASSASGITYETIQAYPQSYSGSNARLKPLVCNNSIVFCERTGQSVRRFAWDLAADGFAGRDVSILSSSIFENNPIVDWTYQQFPYSTLWCVLADGTAASFEYMEEQDILAWATHRHGGGKFKCFATTYGIAPALDQMNDDTAKANATHEEVFAIVDEGHVAANGTWVSTGMFLERMRVKSKPDDTVYHSLCMDSVRVVNDTNGLSLRQIDGLRYVPADTTDGATIVYAKAAAKREQGVEVYEGYTYDADFMSVFPVLARGVVGAGQFDIKDICGVGMRLMASKGGTVRAEGCEETEPIRYADDPGAEKFATFGGGMAHFRDLDAANVKPVGINTRDGRFHVEQAEPWPFQMLMYEVDVEAEVGRG